MISFEEARRLVIEEARILGKERVSLDLAAGRVAAEEIRSRISVPPFRNSAVDGYAVRSEDTAAGPGQTRLKLLAEQPAGEYFRKILRAGQTVKVMTGAPVPAGAEAVVPVEEAKQLEGFVVISRAFKPGENVRQAGEDVVRGQVIIKPGTVLKAPQLGLLAACGVKSVPVYRQPKVAVLITGNELCRPGEKLRPGKIYDANSTILKTLVESSGAGLVSIKQVRDNLKSLLAAFNTSAGQADVVITSGGVSVGDYDQVKEAARRAGGREIFWQVAQKPAKPLAFYRLKIKRRPVWIFGLPGNPGAVMISFEEYVRPFIKKISGRIDFWPREVKASLSVPFKKKKGRLNFVRVKLEENLGRWQATPAGKQESGIISTLSETDGLALIPAGAEFLPAGTRVKVHLPEW